jgi:hypothetical protein
MYKPVEVLPDPAPRECITAAVFDPDPTVFKGQKEYLLKFISEKKKLLRFTPLTSHEFKGKRSNSNTSSCIFSQNFSSFAFSKNEFAARIEFCQGSYYSISIYLTVSGGRGGLASPSGVSCPQFCTSGIQK